jgi:hypothetical protein
MQFDLKSSIFDNRLPENTDLTMCSSTQEPTSFNGTRGINLARHGCGPDNRRVVERGNRSLTVSAHINGRSPSFKPGAGPLTS